MSLWGSIDQANNAPKYKIQPNSPNTGIELYGTTVVGLDNGEVAGGNQSHPGWIRVERGTGYVTSIAIATGGTGYANTDTVRIANGVTNATATVATNANGTLTSVTLTAPGSGFVNSSVLVTTVRAANGDVSAGANATFTVVLGGRAGRIHTETLVAMGSMSANGSSL